MSQMIEDILRLSLSPAVKKVNLSDLAESVAAELKMMAPEHLLTSYSCRFSG
jgi:hypothetical protein